MKILITGFNSFQGVKTNPSEQVVHALASRRRNSSGPELITAVLPTEYLAATRQLRRLIRTARPDAILCLGVATQRDRISLERVALNLDDESTPDNQGTIRRGRKIAPRGPDVYWSTLPLAAMLQRLHSDRTQAYISNHAGTFLCNHAFYVAQQETARLRRRIPCGFIHLPGNDRAAAGRGKRGRSHSIARMIRAVERCLQTLETEVLRKRSKNTKGS